MTLEQFRSSKVIIPWLTHCAIWGIDSEHEDANARVVSYWNGYHIFQRIFKDGTLHYDVIFCNVDETFDNLESAEQFLWDEFAVYEEGEISYNNVKNRLAGLIDEHFKLVLEDAKCSGDIDPMEKVALDTSIESIATILTNMLKRNKI